MTGLHMSPRAPHPSRSTTLTPQQVARASGHCALPRTLLIPLVLPGGPSLPPPPPAHRRPQRNAPALPSPHPLYRITGAQPHASAWLQAPQRSISVLAAGGLQRNNWPTTSFCRRARSAVLIIKSVGGKTALMVVDGLQIRASWRLAHGRPNSLRTSPSYRVSPLPHVAPTRTGQSPP